MIEAPEALYLAEQLTHILQDKLVTLVIPEYIPHKFAFYSRNPESFPERLIGKRVGVSFARAGMVEMNIEDSLLIFTDGANLRYYTPGEKLPAKYQFLMGFDDESCLVVSIRMYGGILCLPSNWKEDKDAYFGNTMNEYYEMACNKPQVMSEDFNLDYFLQLTNEEHVEKKTVKALLATNQTIPGLGNGVLQDILYRSGIHPKKKVKDLSPQEKEKIFYSIKSTLKEMYEGGGRHTETDILGQNGKYVSYLSKDTAGKPCPQCGDVIQKESYLGGSIYYCAECQSL